MPKSKDGYYLHVTCSSTFLEAIRAHSERSGESIAGFTRRMIERGIRESALDGTIYVKPVKPAKAAP